MTAMHPVTPDPELEERHARRIWLGGIAVFFSIQAAIWIVAIWFTGSDLSHAVIPEYDRRALDWDSYRDARAASRGLGWKATLVPVAVPDRPGQVRVELRLATESGTAVEADSVSLSYFHAARAARRQETGLPPVAPGVYAADLNLDRVGLWHFEIRARRGSGFFLDEQRIELGAETISQPVRKYLDRGRLP